VQPSGERWRGLVEGAKGAKLIFVFRALFRALSLAIGREKREIPLEGYFAPYFAPYRL
jgi:hypothetical protein